MIMKRPTLRTFEHSMLGGVLLLAAFLLPSVLTGFMSGNAETVKKQHKTSADIETLMKSVTELNREKKHEKAIDLLLQAVSREKEDSVLRMLLVQTFDLFLEEQVKLGQTALLKNPSDSSHYGRVAGALEILGDNFHAMEILLNGIRHDQDAINLWMRIARLELAAHREAEALDVFKEVIRLDANNADAYNNAAYLLAKATNCDADDLEEAEKFAKKARKLDPKNPEYIDTQAEISFRKGNLKVAKALIEEAIKLSPTNDAYKSQLLRFNPAPLYKAQ